MKVKVYKLNGDAVGDIDLPDEIFNLEWNPDLVHQALMAQRAGRRKPLAHAKTRGEVRGGGAKPWRQKGTGRARHGSIRSPIWIGGGVAHGPKKEKKYAKKINKKMKKAAIFNVVSRKLADNELKIIDSLKLNSAKTKELDSALKKFLAKEKNSKKISALVVPDKDNKSVFRAAANIPKVKSLNAASLNVEDLLKYRHILIDKRAVPEIK